MSTRVRIAVFFVVLAVTLGAGYGIWAATDADAAAYIVGLLGLAIAVYPLVKPRDSGAAQQVNVNVRRRGVGAGRDVNADQIHTGDKTRD